MEGYFVTIKSPFALVHVDTVDFAEEEAARACKDKYEAKGYYVSIWKAFRIYVPQETV